MASPPRTRQRDDAASLNTSHHSSGCTNPPSSDSNDNMDECYLGEWSDDELDILEDGLARYASEESVIKRYEKIATHLQHKTTRDVALRCRMLSKKESSKRNKDSKESASNSPFTFTSQPNASRSYTNTAADGISHSASSGGLTEQLLAQNVLALSLISSNLSTMQTQANVSQENIDLLRQTRENIVRIMNRLNNDPEPMPPSPFTLNEEHASTFTPSPDPSRISSNSDPSRISSNSHTSTSNSRISSSKSREKTARRRRK